MALHPLDALSPDEFGETAAALRRDHGVTDRMAVRLDRANEPSKQVVRAYTPGEPIRRQAFAVLWDREDGRTYEALVDLTDDTVVSFEHVPGVQPNFTVDEWHDCDEVLRSDPQVIEALARRGITDPDLVLIDVWAYRDFLVPEKYKDRRVGWCDVWCRSVPGANPYARYVSGLGEAELQPEVVVLEVVVLPDRARGGAGRVGLGGVWRSGRSQLRWGRRAGR